MRAYLDASVLVALLTDDALTPRADGFLRPHLPDLVLSDFAAAECASAIARRVRTGDISADEGRVVFATLDAWAARSMERIETGTADVRIAEGFLRRLDLTLRTPDALNIALARRVGAVLVTFDEKMRIAAQILGMQTIVA